jgi:hypothetical protein
MSARIFLWQNAAILTKKEIGGGVLNKSRANAINLFTSNTEVFSLVKCSQLRTLTEVVHKGQIK